MLRRFVLPTLIGSVLFYVVLRPFAHWLAFRSGASDAVYAGAVWSLMLVASLIVSFLVAWDFHLRPSRTVIAAGGSAIAWVVVLLAAAELAQWLAPQASWLYSEPASLALMVVLPAAASGITVGVIVFCQPRPSSAV